jgi:polysaccharide export outer membrane protein
MNHATLYRGVLLASAGFALTLTMGGCNVDSFMDPSVVGRWEKTPGSVPVLERIASIEDEAADFVEYSDVAPEDLVPAAQAYRMGPGDVLQIELYDLIERNQKQEYQRSVDARGAFDLPQLGLLYVNGRTLESVKDLITEAMKRYVSEPLNSVSLTQQRQQLYHVLGSVEKPGSYFIPSPDFRLLEGLTSGGRFAETIEEVYIIRQIPLSEALGKPAAKSAAPAADKSKAPVDIIDELTAPKEQKDKPSHGHFAGDVLENQPTVATKREPVVDLVDGTTKTQPGTSENSKTPVASPPTGSDSSWVFIDGKWVQVNGKAETSQEAKAKFDELLTQRVIRVPLKKLLAGDMQYNVILRPGDTIRVPAQPEGLVYMAGQVLRQGPITLPGSGRLTMMRAIDSAGGLGQLAIPERVDLTRVTGKGRQATIRLDLRAINEGTQPDIYLKPDDRINVGTNFWALPLSVLRNGFRASYGFGFILDRNFGNDVFGAPPTNNLGQ